MLILDSELESPSGLSFSPDGLSLLAAGDSHVQVWPRWLEEPARPITKVQHSLERFAFSEDASQVYLYVSGNSYTRVLNLKNFRESTTKLPTGGPSWFHFDTAGGYFLVSHSRGKLSRFDHAPNLKNHVRKVWSIDRPVKDESDGESSALGSHYRFGAICGPAGVFVAMEYRYGRGEPLDGLVVRSVDDGRILHREALSDADGRMLLHNAGLTLAIHPSGGYFAFPQENRVRLWPLAEGVQVPTKLTAKFKESCTAVAFHPSGSLLAATGADGTVRLYDTATWKLTRTLAWDIGILRAVCFTPDGTRAAAIGDGEAEEEKTKPTRKASRAKTGRKTASRKVVVWDVDL